jgi:hypothetical protein
MATIRLRNLKGLDPEVRRRIRKALRGAHESGSDKCGDRFNQSEPNSKWHNVRTTLDGITFASKHEAERYAELKIERRAGEITDLELQKRFSRDVNGVHICDYVADFAYKRNGEEIVEDAKGKATELYRIKKALMLAVLGIEIVES